MDMKTKKICGEKNKFYGDHIVQWIQTWPHPSRYNEIHLYFYIFYSSYGL